MINLPNLTICQSLFPQILFAVLDIPLQDKKLVAARVKIIEYANSLTSKNSIGGHCEDEEEPNNDIVFQGTIHKPCGQFWSISELIFAQICSYNFCLYSGQFFPFDVQMVYERPLRQIHTSKPCNVRTATVGGGWGHWKSLALSWGSTGLPKT